MKKSLLVAVMGILLILLLAGCGCDHEWLAATCTAPKTCQLCGETEGEALGHTLQDATCTDPKTCTVCKATEGEALGHTWQEATTEAPKTCSNCNLTEGSKLDTDPRFTTKDTKFLHGTWTCEVPLTEELFGVDSFPDGLACIFTMEFGNTGELSIGFKLNDEAAFMAALKEQTLEETYLSLEQQGVGRDQADQVWQQIYGMTVEEYVDAMLKIIDINQIFGAINMEGVYYVQDGALYVGLTWNGELEKSTYTLNNGILTVEGLTMEEGGELLQWKKVHTI